MRVYTYFEFIRPGITELDVSNEFEFFMRKQGATSSSFDIIVASGTSFGICRTVWQQIKSLKKAILSH